MKTVATVGLLGLCFCSGLWIRERLGGSTVPPAAVYPADIDLGDRELGEVAVAKFTIANEGGNVLEVSRIRTSCACAGIEQETTAGAARVEKVSIPARSSVKLQARISVRGQPGRPERTVVSFDTNDPERPTGSLTIEPSRVLGIACIPNTVLFNDAVAEQPASRIVEVRSIGYDLPRIESVATNEPGVVRARLLPVGTSPEQGPDGDRLLGCVEVTLQPRPPGHVGGEVVLTVVSGSLSRRVPLPVSANISAAVTVSPSRLSLPIESGAGRLFVANCVVRSGRGTPISVRPGAVPVDYLVEVEEPEVAAATKVVRVKWTPPPGQGAGATRSSPRRRELTLVVRDGEAEYRVSIQVDCTKPE
jgi:hypothetical protein